MNQLTPDQIDKIIAANTARCTPEALAQIAEGRITAEQWAATVRMTAEFMHATYARTKGGFA